MFGLPPAERRATNRAASCFHLNQQTLRILLSPRPPEGRDLLGAPIPRRDEQDLIFLKIANDLRSGLEPCKVRCGWLPVAVSDWNAKPFEVQGDSGGFVIYSGIDAASAKRDDFLAAL
jgi:hypothetical protein